jgi:Mrp family chromosome partitioning ATPase
LLSTIGDTLVRTDTLAAAPVDTAALAAQRDSNRATFTAAQAELDRLREVSAGLDLEEDRERERANAVAPPLALLASAFVLSAIVGFAVALFGELRRPRLSSAAETEKVLGVRVLSTIEPSAPSVERTRRQSDREAPPYVDPHAEGYQLAYLGLATEHPTVLSAIVTGDDPRISAVVACNLAAIAADEARTTIIVELEHSCSAASVLHARAIPGISEVVGQGESWTNATVSAQIGRSRSVDLIPYGRVPIEPSTVAAAVGELVSRLVDRYDGIIFLADPATVKAGLPVLSKAHAVVYCAQPGVSPINSLSNELEEIREAGGGIRGVILWNADRPMLATPRELAGGRSRRKQAPALAMSH